jgi:hypothetical protein
VIQKFDHSDACWYPEVATMGVSDDLKAKAKMTREDGVFTLKLDEGISLAQLSAFAQDMFPGGKLDEIGVWPADDGELVISIRGDGAVSSN